MIPLLAPAPEIPLWPEGVPGGWRVEGAERAERDAGGNLIVSNVSNPRLRAFGVATGEPVIVVPGGGYRVLAADHEGDRIAEWFAARGFAAYVLIHRLPRRDASGEIVAGDAPRERVPSEDLARAMALVRARHPERWLTVLGFSAGGHLAAVAAGRPGGPDRLALIYPAYLTLGKGIAPEARPHRAVPTFGAVAADDFGGSEPRSVGLGFYADKVRAGAASAEIHVTPTGGHGFGFRPHGREASWLPALDRWLDR